MTDPYGPGRESYRETYPQPPQPYRESQPGEPYYSPPQSASQPHGHSKGGQPRRKRRVFLWVFLAVQVIFIIWIIAGVATKPAGPSVAAQTAQVCAHGGWQGLFKSHADCMRHYAVGLNDAGNTGKAIGVAIIVAIWVVVDFFLGLGYGIYRLTKR